LFIQSCDRAKYMCSVSLYRFRILWVANNLIFMFMFIRKHNDVITVKPEPIFIGTNNDGEPSRKIEFKVVRRRNLHCQWLIPVTKAMQRLKKKQTLVIFKFFI
jgi:hypothetical protein